MQDGIEVTTQLACERLLLRVAWLTDHGPQIDIASLYTADGEFDRDGVVTKGRAAIAEMYARRSPSLFTRHLISNFQVVEVTADTARCRSMAAVYRFRSTEGGAPVPPVALSGPEAVTEYDDTLVRTDQGWRLAKRVLRTVVEFK